MKSVFTWGSSLSLLLSLASAQSYDATICGEDRFGEFSDPQVYLPNAWNKNSPDDGFVCMSVDNSTPAFDVTWMWPENIADVHSYPYVRLNDDALPTRLSTIESMRIKSDWMMTLGSPRSPPRDFSNRTWTKNKEKLDEVGVTANAAWDFFLDANRTRTYNPVDSAIEVMIWLGRVGHARPLEGDGVVTTIKLGDHTFQLYYQLNFRSRHVFTWILANGGDVTQFDEDVSPLFEYILNNPPPESDDEDAAEWPEDPYLGLVEFGSETWYSKDNVTFSVANFGLDLEVDQEAVDKDRGSGGGDDEDAGMALGVPMFGIIAPVALLAGAILMF
ncbi:glycoside hydrolase family 12 protein [Sodiomyces alcalophilus JCM 7366]|uniref:glycoside hydrolase family 12 protein n=1 Tax=Sodiomyces alcalophilus JCM 7366 TaxID=591952 RepID=UPI0039B682C5